MANINPGGVEINITAKADNIVNDAKTAAKLYGETYKLEVEKHSGSLGVKTKKGDIVAAAKEAAKTFREAAEKSPDAKLSVDYNKGSVVRAARGAVKAFNDVIRGGKVAEPTMGIGVDRKRTVASAIIAAELFKKTAKSQGNAVVNITGNVSVPQGKELFSNKAASDFSSSMSSFFSNAGQVDSQKYAQAFSQGLKGNLGKVDTNLKSLLKDDFIKNAVNLGDSGAEKYVSDVNKIRDSIDRIRKMRITPQTNFPLLYQQSMMIRNNVEELNDRIYSIRVRGDIDKALTNISDLPMIIGNVQKEFDMEPIHFNFGDVDQFEKVGLRSGQDWVKGFEGVVKDSSKDILGNLNNVRVDVDNSEAVAKIATIKSELQSIGDRKIKTEVDFVDAIQDLSVLRGELEALGRQNVDVKVELDNRGVLASFDRLRAELAARAESMGFEVDGHINMFLNESELAQKMARVVGFVKAAEAGSQLEVDVDINEDEAMAKLAAFKAFVATVGDESVNIDVDVKTAGFVAKLTGLVASAKAAVEAAAINIPVELKSGAFLTKLSALVFATKAAGAAMKANLDSMNLLGGRGAYLAIVITLVVGAFAALIPVLSTTLGLLMGLTTAFGALVAGVGVVAIALAPVVKAMIALNQQKKQAASSSKSLSDAHSQEAKAARDVARAQENLARAYEDQKRTEQDGTRKIVDAQKEIADAKKNAADVAVENAKRVKDANKQLQRSERDYKDTVADVARDIARARQNVNETAIRGDRNVASAKQALKDAVSDAREAQLKYNEALKQASDRLKELHAQLRDTELDQKEAAVKIAKAEEDLAKAKKEGRFDDLAGLQVAIERAQFEKSEAARKNKAIREEHDNIEKYGAKADKNAIAAKKALDKANQDVANKRAKLAEEERQRVLDNKKAEDDYARAKIDGNRRIEDALATRRAAEESIGTIVAENAQRAAEAAQREIDAEIAKKRAIEDVARARQDAARAVEDAKFAAVEAKTNQQNQKQGGGAAAATGGEDPLAKLTPQARELIGVLQTIRPLLDDIFAAAQRGFLPGFTEGIKILSPLLPAFATAAERIGKVLGDMFERLAKELTSEQWKAWGTTLLNWLAPMDQAKGKVGGLETAFGIVGDVLGGLAILFVNTLPEGQSFAEMIRQNASDFKEWATNIRENQDFQAFMTYIKEQGPKVSEMLSEIGGGLLWVAESIAPFTDDVVKGLTDFFREIQNVDPQKIEWFFRFVAGFAVLKIASSVLTTILGVFNTFLGVGGFLLKLFGGVWSWIARILVGLASIIGWPALIVIALGVALILMYNKVGWFKDFVDGAVKAIGNFFKKGIDGIVNAWRAMVAWIKKYVIDPIVAGFGIMWDGVKKGVSAAVDVMGAIITLWVNNVIRAINWMGQKINKVFEALKVGWRIPVLAEITTKKKSSGGGGGRQMGGVPKFAYGGQIPGKMQPAGVDNIRTVMWNKNRTKPVGLVDVASQEWIINSRAVKKAENKFGKGFFPWLNRGAPGAEAGMFGDSLNRYSGGRSRSVGRYAAGGEAKTALNPLDWVGGALKDLVNKLMENIRGNKTLAPMVDMFKQVFDKLFKEMLPNLLKNINPLAAINNGKFNPPQLWDSPIGSVRTVPTGASLLMNKTGGVEYYQRIAKPGTESNGVNIGFNNEVVKLLGTIAAKPTPVFKVGERELRPVFKEYEMNSRRAGGR